MRAQTIEERRRLYLQARLVVERHYARHLTVPALARALATSPRQIQRAYAHFGDVTFREDLLGRRMRAAAELLAQPAIPVADVARLVGYRQPSHFSKAFRLRYSRSPARFRSELLRSAASPHVMLRGDVARAFQSGIGEPSAAHRG